MSCTKIRKVASLGTQHCHVMRSWLPIAQSEGQQLTICEIAWLPVRQNWSYGNSMLKKIPFWKIKFAER